MSPVALNRRLYLAFSSCVLVWLQGQAGFAQTQPQNVIQIDASTRMISPETGYLHMGGTSFNGHSLQVNSRYLVLDNKPWLPVMGEFHYTRYPEAGWEDEILKMKAGGVNIVATYIFWLHHEEVEGQFDWSGERDLRRFVELCAKHGMYVWLRVGPWAHGEARNGGFPDWVAGIPNPRTNDPAYLRSVERFYGEIGKQVQGQMFKDGGPVIGVQLENEYGLHGEGRGAKHILKLKQLAIAAGIEPPLFSVTGWPSLDFPQQEVIPVSGGYPDGFWYGSQTDLPPSMTYLFNFHRELGDMGATVPSEDPTGKVNLDHDPYFAAEEAGGMASAYHRRPVLSANDIAALTVTGIGSGLNLYGYYMYQGGANPEGKLTSLQESTATGYPNDLPEKTYDFNAPLGEFGQERESYRKTRMIHLFLNAYGSSLATMPAFAPAQRVRDAANTTTPRVAVRSDGKSGFVFVNNYVRQLNMPAHPAFQAEIKLPTGTIPVPAHPVELPANSYFVWPFNLMLGQTRLQYSTAQLLTSVDRPEGKLTVFFAVPGIDPEFSFERASVKAILAPKSKITNKAGSTYVTGTQPGMNSTITVTDQAGKTTTILLVSEEQAEDVGVLHSAHADYVVKTKSSLLFDGATLRLRSTASPAQRIESIGELPLTGTKGKPDGMWTSYRFTQPERHLALRVEQTQSATPVANMTMGPYVDWRKTSVPLVPLATAFEKAGVWHLQWENPEFHGLSEVLLQIDYTGDIARLRSGSSLMDDNFFNGIPWQVGLKRFGAESQSMDLQILPMPKSAPIALDGKASALLIHARTNPEIQQIKLIPEYESVLPWKR